MKKDFVVYGFCNSVYEARKQPYGCLSFYKVWSNGTKNSVPSKLNVSGSANMRI